MDVVYNLIPIVFALFFGLTPWLLVLIPVRKAKVWGWWKLRGWQGSLLFALANMALKIGAGLVGFVILQWLGYSEKGTFDGIYNVVNFLDLGLLNGITVIAQRVLTGGHVDVLSQNVGMSVDFAVVFALFMLVWSLRNSVGESTDAAAD